MSELDDKVEAERQYITDEIIKAFGLKVSAWKRAVFGALFRPATLPFARIGVEFDQQVAQLDFHQAAQRALPHFIRSVEVHGAENVPREGALVVSSNHPGAADSLAIAASLPRPDLKIIASDVNFLRGLPAAAEHLIHVTSDTFIRSSAARAALRHLKSGGALLVFASQTIDPDPACMPGAEEALQRWSPSLELFLRHAPEARLLIAIVSGTLSSRWAHSPLVRIRKRRVDRQRLAEFFQVMQQLIFPGSLTVDARLSFAAPLTLQELRIGSAEPLQAIIQKAQALLLRHLEIRKAEAALE